jgi:NhaP-type Na+/H+ or K+/H+ antiporter
VALAVLVKLQLALESAAVSIKPNPNGGPGTPALEKLVNWLAAIVILGCALGLLLGVGQWVLGSKSNNFSHASDGKQKVLYSLLGAFVVGAGAALINFFYTSGSAVK